MRVVPLHIPQGGIISLKYFRILDVHLQIVIPFLHISIRERMMKIEKSFTVVAPRENVWEFITSPESVAPCIPGCEQVEQVGPKKYRAGIRIKIGPIRTKFKVDIDVLEERPPEFASYQTQGVEGGKASRIKAVSKLSLTEIDSATTEVLYTSEINLIGRLGKFSQGMMNKVADSIGEDFILALRKEIEVADES